MLGSLTATLSALRAQQVTQLAQQNAYAQLTTTQRAALAAQYGMGASTQAPLSVCDASRAFDLIVRAGGRHVPFVYESRTSDAGDDIDDNSSLPSWETWFTFHDRSVLGRWSCPHAVAWTAAVGTAPTFARFDDLPAPADLPLAICNALKLAFEKRQADLQPRAPSGPYYTGTPTTTGPVGPVGVASPWYVGSAHSTLLGRWNANNNGM
jgi:hypothetical protein